MKKLNFKKLIALGLTAAAAVASFTACSTNATSGGSDGNTGLRSAYLKFFLYDLAENMGSDGRTVISATRCLSADVNAAYDPTFPDGYERNNCSFVNKGIVVTKYTGARGKSGTSDASAEYVGLIHNLSLIHI